MRRAPIATLALVGACLAVHVLGGAQAFAYEREHLSVLRLVSASFAHYDWLHLTGNLLALSVLGSVVERERSPGLLVCLSAATICSTMIALHALVPECATFAGVSNVNFALLAFVLCTLQRRRLAAAGLLAGVAVFQLLQMEDPLTLAPVQPVWQLHLLALSIGAGTGWFLSTRGGVSVGADEVRVPHG